MTVWFFLFFFFADARTMIIFRQPPLSSVSNIFLLPLDIGVWHCCILMIFVVFLIMFLQVFHPLLRNHISFIDVLTFVWGAFCQQGTHLRVPTMSGRIVVLTTFLAAVALFTSYSASIVAILQSSSHSIRTLDDLIASPLKMGIQESGYNRFYYLRGNDPLLTKVYDKKVKMYGEDGWIYDPFAGIERVRTELFAYQVETKAAYKAVARTFSESEKCSLDELELVQLPMTTITLERNSPYKELFRQR